MSTLILRPTLIVPHDHMKMSLGPRTVGEAGLDVLVRKYGILLWNNQGRWGLVSPSQLAEWLRGYRLFKRQKEQFPRITVKAPTIDFRSTTPLSDSVARVLRSQRPQELNQPKAKAKPPTAHETNP